jgi:uncharacterized protein with HEPN domain
VKDDRVYLGHVRGAIHDIEEYTSGGRDAFMSDRMQRDAAIRRFEIIGSNRAQRGSAWSEDPMRPPP